ncbi:unnamed protein product [Coffea canephora]|uniref:Uncharacterized protein n=1 Tax=Coffea canephora TaxID=49390 RepID=A0A068TSS3_COFCA|nr:unnamed protein product [Coffea canephora]
MGTFLPTNQKRCRYVDSNCIQPELDVPLTTICSKQITLNHIEAQFHSINRLIKSHFGGVLKSPEQHLLSCILIRDRQLKTAFQVGK